MNIKDAIVLAENGIRMRNKNGNILKISYASVIMTNEIGDQLVPSYDGWEKESGGKGEMWIAVPDIF